MNTTRTDKKITIAIVSHALVVPENRNRWRLLAEDKKYEVHLLVPEIWQSEWFGEDDATIYETKSESDGNFHIHPIATTDRKNWGKYLFKSTDAHLRKISPDLIYIVHEESILIHHQIYLYKKLYAPKAKVIFFSMNARGVPYTRENNPLKRAVKRAMWNNIRKNTDAALVHYPGCLDSLRDGGYRKPIYMQTQIGVDEKLFRPDSTLRDEYRKRLSIAKDEIVIGYVGRLTEAKGIRELIPTFLQLSKSHSNIRLLLVGNGDLKNWIESQVTEADMSERVTVTGFVAQGDVPGYMNAMDIFVLGSKTMPDWIDTFPLVTVQAQATGLPVVASTSGSIPWQLGDSALLFTEGDRDELRERLEEFIENPPLRREYAQKGRERSLSYFCIGGMTENFKRIIEQIMVGDYIYHEDGEKYIQWKAYR